MNHGNPSIDDVMKLMDNYGVAYSPSTVLRDLERFVRYAKQLEKENSASSWRRGQETAVYDSYGKYKGRR